MNKFLVFILLGLFSINVVAAEIDLDNSFNHFKNTGTVENTYNMITCNQKLRGENTNLSKIWPNVCQIVKKSNTCKAIPKEDQLECKVDNPDENNVDVASFGFLYNCLWGGGEAIVNMLKYVGELVASTVKMTYDSDYRNKKKGDATALADSIMGYISLEYAKELDATGSDFKASAAVVGNVTQLLFKGIADSLKKEFFELGCYNQAARQAKICESITSKLVPPYAVLKILSKAKIGLKNKLTSHRQKKIKNKELRAETGRVYNDTSTLPKTYDGEETGKVFGTNVEYLDEKARLPHEVFIGKDGKLYDIMGDLIDTSKAEIVGGKTVGIYVMAPNGKIYMSNTQVVGKFHHSSFLAGGDAAVAGELIVKKGVLVAINRHSGHYKPKKEQLRQIMLELKGRGADLKTVRVDTTVPNE